MIKYPLLLLFAAVFTSCTTVVEPVHTEPTTISRETRTTVNPYVGGTHSQTTTTIER